MNGRMGAIASEECVEGAISSGCIGPCCNPPVINKSRGRAAFYFGTVEENGARVVVGRVFENRLDERVIVSLSVG